MFDQGEWICVGEIKDDFLTSINGVDMQIICTDIHTRHEYLNATNTNKQTIYQQYNQFFSKLGLLNLSLNIQTDARFKIFQGWKGNSSFRENHIISYHR